MRYKQDIIWTIFCLMSSEFHTIAILLCAANAYLFMGHKELINAVIDAVALCDKRLQLHTVLIESVKVIGDVLLATLDCIMTFITLAFQISNLLFAIAVVPPYEHLLKSRCLEIISCT